MTKKQKLGLAYVHLNCWEWDDYMGDKPIDFDKIPRYNKQGENSPVTKQNYIRPIMDNIKMVLSERYLSWCWFKFELHKSYLQWLLYWYFKRYNF